MENEPDETEYHVDHSGVGTIVTVDGRVVWVPAEHKPFLQEWDWHFDTERLTAFRLDEHRGGEVLLADQINCNTAVRSPTSTMACPPSSYALYRIYGHNPEYPEYLKEYLRYRVVMSDHFQCAPIDSHNFLGMLHATVRIEYLRWLHGRNYLILKKTGPERAAISPVWDSLGHWAGNTMYQPPKGEPIQMTEHIRSRVVEVWQTTLQEEEKRTPSEYEKGLRKYDLSVSGLLVRVMTLIWPTEIPILLS